MSISVAVKMRQAKNGELLLMLYRTVLTELEGIHKKVRLIIVERATCGGKLEGDKLAKQYSHSMTALYKQLSLVKDKFRKIERLAINELDSVFFEKELLSCVG